jgi:hypothetical protein
LYPGTLFLRFMTCTNSVPSRRPCSSPNTNMSTSSTLDGSFSPSVLLMSLQKS